MARARKVCVVTGSRAEYGLLFWLLKEIQANPELELQLVVTGMHLASQFGRTRDEIVADGFPIAVEIDMLLGEDTPSAVAKSVGAGVIGMADAFAELKPDLMVALGDRFEILAAAQTALLLNIPIAHIHGGEVTEGAIDDSIRHAVTKMATLHFTAAEPYARRLEQMGEDPSRIFVVGALATDNIRRATLLDRDALARRLGFSLAGLLFLVTYHPTTAAAAEDEAAVGALVAALEGYPDARVIVTGTNADTGHAAIVRSLRDFVESRANRTLWAESLGRVPYLSCMAAANAVIGNSSSGIIEAPMLATPSVNVGDRQKGRLRAPSIIDCTPDAAAIGDAIATALSPEHRAVAAERRSHYGQGTAAADIARVLGEYDLSQADKTFYESSAQGRP